jgi:hypothetical protein
MHLYCFNGSEFLYELSLINHGEHEIRRLAQEIKSKNGDKTRVFLSEKRHIEPKLEELIHETDGK